MLGMRKTTSTKASDRLRLALNDWKLAPPPKEFMAPVAKRRGAQGGDTEPGRAPVRGRGESEPRFRMGSWDVKSIRPLFFIVAAIVIVVIGLWFLGRPAVIEPSSSGSTSSTESNTGSELALDAGSALPELVVHVAGSVKNPGLYRLPIGARVAEAIEAAGGVSKKNAANSVNLAREVVDGEQILVGENTEPGGLGTGISINSASAGELEDLPGVGPVIAARIVAYREAHGPFASIDALGEVSGVGDSILGSILDIARL